MNNIYKPLAMRAEYYDLILDYLLLSEIVNDVGVDMLTLQLQDRFRRVEMDITLREIASRVKRGVHTLGVDLLCLDEQI